MGESSHCSYVPPPKSDSDDHIIRKRKNRNSCPAKPGLIRGSMQLCPLSCHGALKSVQLRPTQEWISWAGSC